MIRDCGNKLLRNRGNLRSNKSKKTWSGQPSVVDDDDVEVAEAGLTMQQL